MSDSSGPFGKSADSEGGRGGKRSFKQERPPLDALFGKPVPQAIEVEMALLGAMIIEPSVTGDVIMLLKSPDFFYVEYHKRIYQSLITLYDRHQTGDLIQLTDALREDEAVQQVGGVRYLEQLARETPGPAGAIHWARIIADKAKLRSLIYAASDIVHSAYTMGQGTEESATEIIDKAEQQIFEIARKHELFEPQAMADLVAEEYERLDAMQNKGVSGIRTHFAELDDMLGGLQPGEMTIVAARPSMGKTAMALNLAEQVAMGGGPDAYVGNQGVPVGFFSLEMSKGAIVQRLLSARSKVDLHLFRTIGEIKSEHEYRDIMQRIEHACDELRNARIYVDDMPALSVMALRARARRMVQQYGIKAIFIDYLQLMTAPAFARESRQVEVGAISRGIKALARELKLPIVCLAQLNRGPESRSDNRPRMSDLRESGSIEQDADVIMLLHREEYYHVGDPNWANDNPDKIGVAELIIAKQRNGPTGAVEFVWDSGTTRFKSRASRGGRGYADAAPSHSGYGDQEAKPAPRGGGQSSYGGGAGGGGGGGGSGGGYGGNGGSGGGGGYADPLPGPGAAAPAPQRVAFAPGKKSGPISDHRDGGGPDREPPPFNIDEDADEAGGMPF